MRYTASVDLDALRHVMPKKPQTVVPVLLESGQTYNAGGFGQIIVLDVQPDGVACDVIRGDKVIRLNVSKEALAEILVNSVTDALPMSISREMQYIAYEGNTPVDMLKLGTSTTDDDVKWFLNKYTTVYLISRSGDEESSIKVR